MSSSEPLRNSFAALERYNEAYRRERRAHAVVVRELGELIGTRIRISGYPVGAITGVGKAPGKDSRLITVPYGTPIFDANAPRQPLLLEEATLLRVTHRVIEVSREPLISDTLSESVRPNAFFGYEFPYGGTRIWQLDEHATSPPQDA